MRRIALSRKCFVILFRGYGIIISLDFCPKVRIVFSFPKKIFIFRKKKNPKKKWVNIRKEQKKNDKKKKEKRCDLSYFYLISG